MRILFASTFGHLPDVVGGLQTTTDELCRALERRGITVAVLCGAIDDAVVPRADRLCGYQVIRAPEPADALPAVVAAFQPSAIVVQTGPELVRLLVAALETKRPTAVYLHNVEQNEIGGVLLPDPAILFLANSPFTAARWHVAFGLEAAVVPPYVEPAGYIASPAGRAALFVNPTVPKGVERFFQLAAARPALPFTVVESWSLAPAWRRFCQERAAALGNVTWLAPTRDMRPLYAAARVLLMPSLWEETYGRTVVEAQLNGLPVLGSTRGNLPDTIGPGGLVLDVHAPLDAWAAALDRLWADADGDGAFAAAARRHAARPEIAPDIVLERFVALVAGHAGSDA